VVSIRLSPFRPRISPFSDFRIKRLLVVSGPSGSGKTTFLDQLASRALPAELTAELPPGASEWPQTNGFGIRGRAGAIRDEAGRQVLEGVVLHYDIMRVFDTMIDRYEDDPALFGLSLAEDISVVLIRAPAELLVRQVHQKRPDPGRMAAALKAVERGIRLALRPKGRPVYREAAFADRRASLGRHYRERGFLDDCYARWVSFLNEFAGGKMTSPILHVQPVPTSGGGSFRLLREVESAAPLPAAGFQPVQQESA
jgi:hypothetical protein